MGLDGRVKGCPRQLINSLLRFTHPLGREIYSITLGWNCDPTWTHCPRLRSRSSGRHIEKRSALWLITCSNETTSYTLDRKMCWQTHPATVALELLTITLPDRSRRLLDCRSYLAVISGLYSRALLGIEWTTLCRFRKLLVPHGRVSFHSPGLTSKFPLSENTRERVTKSTGVES